MADYLSVQPVRIKHGIMDLGGEGSPPPLGLHLIQHIQRLEEEQKSFLHISQEQVTTDISHYVIQYYHAKSKPK